MCFSGEPMPSRPAILALLLAACTASIPEPAVGPGPGSSPSGASPSPPLERFERLACGLPRQWLLRMWRGYHPERSGEIQILLEEGHAIGGGLPHTGPWDFLQRVPMVWYGPGHVREGVTVDRPVTVADVAPTQAELLEFPFDAPDGRPMEEALLPPGERDGPPPLVVTLIWDSAGVNVLEEWPDAWPHLRSLMARGASFERATVGSSPSATAQVHATIGTGAFPRRHGIPAHSMRVGERVRGPFQDISDLLLPTLADVYDAAMGNRPEVVLAGSVSLHLGLVGHGAEWEGADPDTVVLRQLFGAETLGAEGVAWNLPPQLAGVFRFPRYANDLPPLDAYLEDVDMLDGLRDGMWHGTEIRSERLLNGFHTPARVPYQTRLIEELIRREGLGADEVPDLLFVNYKLMDTIGHYFSMNGPEMRDSLQAQDEELRRLVRFLDETVGERRWVLALTADHGSMPRTDLRDGVDVSGAEIGRRIDEAFDLDDDDRPVVQLIQKTEIFIDTPELSEHGFTLEDVAALLMDLRLRDAPIPEASPDDPDAPVFRAVFPSGVLERAPCLPSSG